MLDYRPEFDPSVLAGSTPVEALYFNLDGDCRICAASPETIEKFGQSPERLLGQSLLPYLCPSDADTLRSQLQTISNPSSEPVQLHFVLPGLPRLPVQAQLQKLVTATGQPCWSLICTPIASSELATLLVTDSCPVSGLSVYRALTNTFPNGMVLVFDGELRYCLVEGRGLRDLNIASEDWLGKTLLDTLPTHACEALEPLYRAAIAGYESVTELAYAHRYYLVHGLPIHNEGGESPLGMAIAQDITPQKQAEIALQRQADAERQRSLVAQFTAEFARHLRQSLDLDQILEATVAKIQQMLEADRVLIYRFQAEDSGAIIQEAIAANCSSIMGTSLPASLLALERQSIATSHYFASIHDSADASLPPVLRDFLQRLDVRARLVAPILQNETLWGLLIVHQCSESRQWHPWEVELLSQLAGHIESAIYHSELYQQVQRLNADLEHQIQERTTQLQLAYEFEATLKRITDKVRDSLDEDQILQAAVEELATVLGVSSCNAAIYDIEQGTSTIHYEYTTTVSPYQGRVSRLSAFPDIYVPLTKGKHLQFCSLAPNPVRGFVSTLAVPMLDDKGVLGDLWLINHKEYAFSEQDIRLAQQVANQCAIALRQARLYQAAQAQVKELERLNRLKDDFLSTVSHELRTPMSNIKMAIQMLEILLKQSGALASLSERAARYFKILHEESQREINLINDLLDLSRLDAGADTIKATTIELNTVLPPLTQAFEERTQNHQQTLRLVFDNDLPRLTTDVSKLERIITELLTNACKYTPAQEVITVSVETMREEDRAVGVRFSIINTGAEIPPHELDNIFEKFYRIPNNDPWQYGGTGLGLALVKKLVERLEGTIEATSSARQTCFCIELPLFLRSKTIS
ncbi:GAF domain-containing protein [Leptolyngbya sp. AN02str]|uniref:GAF domain-containing protein n=1 Tax=Leptolyngbya sp. AN02str TaxID=3423363 RepID=UPI003D312109